MTTEPAHIALLRMLEPKSGEWNWYQLSRAWVSRNDPAALDLKTLIEQGLVEEIVKIGEPLPRLVITEAGTNALRNENRPSLGS